MDRATTTVVEINLKALRHNFRQLQKKLPRGTKPLCVVKSNAYGHGAVPVARALEKAGAVAFGVGTVDEGVDLRQGGIRRPILILLGYLEGRFDLLLKHRLTPVVYEPALARRLNDFCRRRGKRLEIHVKVDTGMTRLGVLPSDLPSFIKVLSRCDALRPVGLLSHLADAGEKKFTRLQAKRFEAAQREFQKAFPEIVGHLANSQGVIDGMKGSLSRLGIALYGAYPLEKDVEKIHLKPVLSWKTRLLVLKKVPAGTPVSYGRTFVTKRPSLIGVLPVGYADGYRRWLSNRAQVLVRGRRVPVAGRICMDLTMIDLTGVSGVRVGDEVVLIGKQDSQEIRAEEMARWAETISYEIFCGISGRVPRVYC